MLETQAGAEAPQATESGAGAFALMAQMAGQKSSGKGKPVIHEPMLDPAIAAYIDKKRAFDDAEALMNQAKDQILAHVRPARLALCVQHGKVIASVSVNGKLTMTQDKRWSNVPELATERLKEVFGPTDFDRFFKPTLKVALKETSANDQAVLQSLIDKLGLEFVQQHFDISHNLVVQETFHHDFTTSAAVQAKAKPFIDEQTLKPWSPSLKVS